MTAMLVNDGDDNQYDDDDDIANNGIMSMTKI